MRTKEVLEEQGGKIRFLEVSQVPQDGPLCISVSWEEESQATVCKE
jgi:hypothetical protein